MKDIVIIGGGLAGLIAAIELATGDYEVSLFEKKKYPFHRVCGEYISNEVRPYLEKKQLLPSDLSLARLKRFEFSSIKGRSLQMPLDLGGFGLSRYALDFHLANKAKSLGVKVHEQTSIVSLKFTDSHFELSSSNGQQLEADVVIGAFGKRSLLDKKLNRDFARRRSPYLGVKYHIRTDFPKDQISLLNFEGGYCGISAIEDDRYNLCYLGSRDTLKQYGSIAEMEKEVLYQNPKLKSIFRNADFLFEQPEVINEFSFEPKRLIESHVLMAGDAAGLITPLCGNGMAMAIHSGKILADCIKAHYSDSGLNREAMEKEYTEHWNSLFKKRLWVGRQTQKLFGSKFTSEIAVGLMKALPPLARTIMKNTHGQPF
ncbi:NAD(P)/FAD-dependent oxidoreductase [Roseivirga sp.]|uniref:NAD(P)/FAD-dependent oxidoreductase n=1 Tax=Roseivirga sp. TaxID=1964215 RepID=UPI003B51D8C0